MAERWSVQFDPSRNAIEVAGDVRGPGVVALLDAARRLDLGADAVMTCAKLEEIDAGTLQVLLALDRALRERARALRLDEIPASIAELLSTCGAASLLERPELP